MAILGHCSHQLLRREHIECSPKIVGDAEKCKFCFDLHFGLQQEVVISKTSLYGSEWMFRHTLPVIELLHVVLKCIGRILSCYGFPLAVRCMIILWKIFLLFLRRQLRPLDKSILVKIDLLPLRSSTLVLAVFACQLVAVP